MATERSNDVRAFRSFLDEKLSNTGASLTLDDCLDLWDAETQSATEPEETVQAVREALDDTRAGDTGIPAREFLAQARRERH